MPTLYTSDRHPVGFTVQDPASVRNGSFAKAGTITGIVENQHYLGMGLTGGGCFFQARWSQTSNAFNATAGPWTNETKTIQIPVPPFAEFCEFWFYATKNKQTSTTEAYIDILPYRSGSPSTADGQRITHIPAGEDLTGSAKSSLDGIIGTGMWVGASGVSFRDFSFATDPGAVQLVASPSNVWQRVLVNVVVSQYTHVAAACYHVLPARHTYTITS